MSSKIAIHEGARVAPVGAGWAAIMSAEPSTQITIVAGLLTCIYLLAQLWLIVRRARIEKQKLEMLQREHDAALSRHAAEMAKLQGRSSEVVTK